MPFRACAECHPAMVDSSDAKSIPIPVLILASKDEDANEVAKFQKLLTVKNRVEIFGDQSHGWMAARADLNDPRVKSEYARGYAILLDFFHEHL
jgi:dienelactone hydrolase